MGASSVTAERGALVARCPCRVVPPPLRFGFLCLFLVFISWPSSGFLFGVLIGAAGVMWFACDASSALRPSAPTGLSSGWLCTPSSALEGLGRGCGPVLKGIVWRTAFQPVTVVHSGNPCFVPSSVICHCTQRLWPAGGAVPSAQPAAVLRALYPPLPALAPKPWAG